MTIQTIPIVECGTYKSTWLSKCQSIFNISAAYIIEPTDVTSSNFGPNKFNILEKHHKSIFERFPIKYTAIKGYFLTMIFVWFWSDIRWIFYSKEFPPRIPFRMLVTPRARHAHARAGGRSVTGQPVAGRRPTVNLWGKEPTSLLPSFFLCCTTMENGPIFHLLNSRGKMPPDTPFQAAAATAFKYCTASHG